MAIKEQHPKTLRLKFGEYYSLKITDSGKNIINNVEITPVSVETKQHVLSAPALEKNNVKEEEEDWVKELQEGLGFNRNGNKTDAEQNEQDMRENDFYSWTYTTNENRIDESFKERDTLLEKKRIQHGVEETDELQLDIPSHTVECEVQIMRREKTYFLWWETGYKNIEYKWSREYATVEISQRDLNQIEFKIIPNKKSLESFFRKKTSSKECYVLNWRYRVTGGAVSVEKENKMIFQDYDDIQGKQSYNYPENTLLQRDATVFNNIKLTDYIGNHILDTYKNGRETFQMTWQGDPTMTIGDFIILENKLGIEKKFMITGNEFVLENNGKFYMQTEGISV